MIFRLQRQAYRRGAAAAAMACAFIALAGGLAVIDGGTASSSVAVRHVDEPIKSDSIRFEVESPRTVVNAEARRDRIDAPRAIGIARAIVRPVPKPTGLARAAANARKRAKEAAALAATITQPLVGEPMQLVTALPEASTTAAPQAKRTASRLGSVNRTGTGLAAGVGDTASHAVGGVAGAIGL
jgi:hypothetical protein